MKSNLYRTLAAVLLCVTALVAMAADQKKKPRPAASAAAAKPVPPEKDALVGPGDWNQWGGGPTRNNTPDAKNLPIDWDVGKIDRKTGEWQTGSGVNIKWVAKLGSQTYGNPVIANGQVYVGTNNGGGWLERYPRATDLGCLLAFKEADGQFLWQHTSEKLPTGRVHDFPMQGICCAPLVEGERLWFVTSRGEVRCLDTQGFYDGENDGSYQEEPVAEKEEADVIWVLDMMKDLDVSQHNMACCNVLAVGDLMFLHTSNGVDESHVNLPAPTAPSFICIDKNTGEVHWTDNSPGTNVLHGQWTNPAYAVIDDVPQIIFPGGDGWVYAFRGDKGKEGKPELLWEFDCNPKESKYAVAGKSTRNHFIATPLIYDDLVYIGVGEDPDHGEGVGHLWCIDPTKRGDLSTELVFNAKDPEKPLDHRKLPDHRLQACIKEQQDFTRANPNAAAVWHYSAVDSDGDKKITFEETMHRTMGTAAIKDGLLVVPDFSGLVHCLDAKTGERHWTHDMLAACWGSPLIADGKVYIGDEDGDVTIFALSPELDILAEISMNNSVYSTPVVANGVLYISNKTHLFAIAPEGAEVAATKQE